MRLRSIPLSAWIGLAGIAIALFCALFAPWIAPHGESEIVGEIWAPMGGEYLLGTDNLGRDLLSRLIFGARTTIFVALAATVLSFSLGMLLSFTAAVTGGLVDQTFSRQIFPVLMPLAVDPAHPFPYISGLSLNLSVRVRNPKTEKVEFARLKVPQVLPRFVPLPDDGSGRMRFLTLEDLISNHLGELFPGMEILEHHEFRVTRNEDDSYALDIRVRKEF